MKWTTATGERIDIRKMEYSHLVNTIRFLERLSETSPVLVGGNDINEMDYDEQDTVINGLRPDEWVKTLKRELNRRRR